jgi:hypothetical protein
MVGASAAASDPPRQGAEVGLRGAEPPATTIPLQPRRKSDANGIDLGEHGSGGLGNARPALRRDARRRHRPRPRRDIGRHALALACASPTSRRPGSAIPATAPASDSAAETRIARAKPSAKSWPEPRLPKLENTATAMAIPSTPPRYRNVLKVPTPCRSHVPRPSSRPSSAPRASPSRRRSRRRSAARQDCHRQDGARRSARPKSSRPLARSVQRRRGTARRSC